ARADRRRQAPRRADPRRLHLSRAARLGWGADEEARMSDPDPDLASGRPAPLAWQSTLADGRVRCELCPRFCTMKEGQRGFCFVRGVHEGRVVLTSYGRASGFCVDPIEKKPLSHFLPGT